MKHILFLLMACIALVTCSVSVSAAEVTMSRAISSRKLVVAVRFLLSQIICQKSQLSIMTVL